MQKVIINPETNHPEIHTDGVALDINFRTELTNSNDTPYYLGTFAIDLAHPTTGEVQTMRPTAMIYKASLFESTVEDDERTYTKDADGKLVPLMKVGERYPIRLIDTQDPEQPELLVIASSLTQGERISKTDSIAGAIFGAGVSQIDAAEAEA